MIESLLLPFLGVLIGIVAAMLGIGGGVFTVPLLTLLPLYELSATEAVGTSLATIIFTSLASTANYSRQKRIDYKTGLILAAATIPGAWVGAYLTSIIEERMLGLIFGFFLIFVALRMIFKFGFLSLQRLSTGRGVQRRIVGSDGSVFEYDANVRLGLALSFFGGFASRLLGIGGGSVLVPIMTLAMCIPMHVTVATSMFIMVFTSMSGVVQHFLSGNVRFEYALPLALGTVFGAQLGAHVSKRVSAGNLRRIFGVVLIFISVRMILKFIY
ncbi:sulfite exporter TauE/SafE family protein [Candidatus Bathyarchaeota archaeon]|nr:sulfite exporter TauE/SafE family protein [Candidatus Bathyarchaeota archaeon]